MNRLITSTWLLLGITLILGCSNTEKTAQNDPPPVNYYPTISLQALDSMRLITTTIDFIFHNLPVSASITDSLAIRSIYSHYTVNDPQIVNHGCKSVGRASYVAKGNLLYFGDIFYSEKCSFVLFIRDDKPAFAVKLNQGGLNFLHQLGMPMMQGQ